MTDDALRITFEKVNPKPGDTSDYVMDLGEIQSITKTYNSSTKPTPVIIYGYSGCFMMDMGVSASYSISYTRISPLNYDNSSVDSRDWTNATWKKRFKEMVDTWQAIHEGYKMEIISPDDDLYPSSTQYGYIKSLPMNHSVGDIRKLSGRIDFTLGKLKMNTGNE